MLKCTYVGEGFEVWFLVGDEYKTDLRDRKVFGRNDAVGWTIEDGELTVLSWLGDKKSKVVAKFEVVE